MATFIARIMNADTGGENAYRFEGPDDRFEQSPLHIIRTFFKSIEHTMFRDHHVDYEIHTAIQKPEHNIVLVIGCYHLHSGDDQPFMMMISPAGDEDG